MLISCKYAYVIFKLIIYYTVCKYTSFSQGLLCMGGNYKRMVIYNNIIGVLKLLGLNPTYQTNVNMEAFFLMQYFLTLLIIHRGEKR